MPNQCQPFLNLLKQRQTQRVHKVLRRCANSQVLAIDAHRANMCGEGEGGALWVKRVCYISALAGGSKVSAKLATYRFLNKRWSGRSGSRVLSLKIEISALRWRRRLRSFARTRDQWKRKMSLR